MKMPASLPPEAGLHEDLSGLPPGSGIPLTRRSENYRARLIAGAAGNRIIPAMEGDRAVVSLNFEGYRRAQDKPAGGKGSKGDRPGIKAGRTESNCSAVVG